MDGQINLFEFMGEKPPVGSTVYFATNSEVEKATVISHDASFAGLSFEGYIKVRTSKGEIYAVAIYYSSKEDAKRNVAS